MPWRREMQPSPALLPGKSHGQRGLVGYNPWDLKESNTTEQLTHTLQHNATRAGFCFKFELGEMISHLGIFYTINYTRE